VKGGVLTSGSLKISTEFHGSETMDIFHRGVSEFMHL